MNFELAGSLTRRGLAALLGASGGVLLAACLDARAAARAAEIGFSPVLLASLGLAAPLGLSLGLGAGLAQWLLLPPSALERLREWFGASGAERSGRAFLLGLAPLAGALWFVVLSRWALSVLASPLAPRSAGAALGLAALALGLVLSASVRALSRGLAVRVAWRAEPLWVGAVSLCGVIGALALAIASGEPSGAGGPLSMLGVLTRDELDFTAGRAAGVHCARRAARRAPRQVSSRAARRLDGALPAGPHVARGGRARRLARGPLGRARRAARRPAIEAVSSARRS
ncbi:MAG: hypothetical protein QM756_26425 [Polyangiaceae bacterium]